MARLTATHFRCAALAARVCGPLPQLGPQNVSFQLLTFGTQDGSPSTRSATSGIPQRPSARLLTS